MITCTLRNEDIDLQEIVELRETTNAELFLSPEVLAESEQYFELKPKITDWIKSDEGLFKPFQAVGEKLSIQPEELLRVFLFMIAKEDRAGYRLLVDRKNKIKNKEDFLERFRKYQRYWTPSKEIKNEIAPDILKSAVCHILYYTSNGKTAFDVPTDVVPYLLNVEGVMPDRPPEGFDPNSPYEGDEYVEPEQKKFFNLFSFLKKTK